MARPKKRLDEALRVLNSTRPQRDIDNGFIETGTDAIELVVEKPKGADRPVHLVNLFRGKMRWRTCIAWSMFAFLQITGMQRFVNSFGANSMWHMVLPNNLLRALSPAMYCKLEVGLFQIIMYEFLGPKNPRILGRSSLLCVPLYGSWAWCGNKSDYGSKNHSHGERHSSTEIR